MSQQINAQLILKMLKIDGLLLGPCAWTSVEQLIAMEIKQNLCRLKNVSFFPNKSINLHQHFSGDAFLSSFAAIIPKNTKNIGLFRYGRIKYTKNKYIKPKKK